MPRTIYYWFWVATKFFSSYVSRQSWPGKDFYVAKELAVMEVLCRDRTFYVASECEQMERFVLRQSNSMSRHSWPGWEDFLSRLSIFMSRQSWPRQGEIMSRQSNSRSR